MSTQPYGVLLIPADGDPRGLLKRGPCGARPPVAVRYTDLDGRHWWCDERDRHCLVRALVLAWDGKVIPEGMDRAARVWEANTEEESRGLEPYNLWWPRLVDAQNLAAELEVHDLGRSVEVDEHGKVIG